MKVDAHHHLWRRARGDYAWMTPDKGAIYRDFAPSDLAPHLKQAGIEKTIVVQAAETVAETEFLISITEQTDWISGVVGWVDMESPDAIPDLDRLSRSAAFKGIRPMIQGIADDDWILNPRLDPVFDALVEMGLAFDALVLPRHLSRLLKRLDKHPGLKCVIDHGAKPDLAAGDLQEWKIDMSKLANSTSCFCKFSGLVTEAGAGNLIDTIRPAAEHILAEFGAKRVMFGSDWPVINLASNYADWVKITHTLVHHFSPEDKDSLWRKTAEDFYSV